MVKEENYAIRTDINQLIANELDTSGFFEGALGAEELAAIFPNIVSYLVIQCVASKHVPFLSGAIEHHVDTMEVDVHGQQKKIAVTTEISFHSPLDGWLGVTFLIVQNGLVGRVGLEGQVGVVEKVEGFWARRALKVLEVQRFLQRRLSQSHQVIEESLTENLHAQGIHKMVNKSLFTFRPDNKIWAELWAVRS